MLKPKDREDFPNCVRCPYVQHGTWRVCVPCATELLSLITDPCPICSQERAGEQCRNRLCRGQEGEVAIEQIRAITLFQEPLRKIVHKYKYEEKVGWAVIFARLLLGHMETNWTRDDVDLIVANPSSQSRGHVSQVLESAKVQDVLGSWPFDDTRDPAFGKTGSTRQSAGGDLVHKREAAMEHATALCLLHPERISGKKIVVFDDICTTGLQLNAVAKRLVGWGAQVVYGVVLARQPWSGS